MTRTVRLLLVIAEYATVLSVLAITPLLNNGQALISFDNWERHKNLYSKELTDMVFTLPQNTVSEIIAVKKNPLVQVSDPTMEDYAYAFVKVAFVSDGGEVSYDEWLKKARASAQVNEYI